MLSLDSAALIASDEAATKISEAVVASGEISVEAWIAPDNLTQRGPARIVTLSSDSLNRNVTLGQDRDEFQVRLRTTTTGTNGVGRTVGSSSDAVTTDLSHVVYTRDASGDAHLYVDGVLVASETIDGSLANWDESYRFGLGDELSTGRPFVGEYDLVAVYGTALTGDDVAQNFDAGPGGLEAEPEPVPTTTLAPTTTTVTPTTTTTVAPTTTPCLLYTSDAADE